MPDIDNSAGDADSSRSLWLTIRNFFEGSTGDRSLRAQLEEAIDVHEEESAAGTGQAPVDGDLLPLERQMLRNLLHFSEHDAEDVAVPRGEIIAVDASISWSQLAEQGYLDMRQRMLRPRS